MLQTQAVEPATLELLKSLQKKEYLSEFYLVGGTALALYYGHRYSIDIDLFSNKAFEAQKLLEQLQQDYSYQLNTTAENTLKGSITDINVYIITHRYQYLKEPNEYDAISLLSKRDIAAMKLNAIAVSGQRTKDFIDIYYLLNTYSIGEMITFYKTKYEQKDATHILKSLIYFDDVDLATWPRIISEPNLKWERIKKCIQKRVLEYTNENL